MQKVSGIRFFMSFEISTTKLLAYFVVYFCNTQHSIDRHVDWNQVAIRSFISMTPLTLNANMSVRPIAEFSIWSTHSTLARELRSATFQFLFVNSELNPQYAYMKPLQISSRFSICSASYAFKRQRSVTFPLAVSSAMFQCKDFGSPA